MDETLTPVGRAGLAAGFGTAIRTAAGARDRVAWLAIGTVMAGLGVRAALTVPWDGFDLNVYLAAAAAFPQPYDCAPTGACFRYSPMFAALVVPLTWIPFDAALLLWRVASVAALIVALRGMAPALALGIILSPWIIADLSVGNTTTFALAAMIAVLRWPSVRKVVLYAALVALVPKPSFLPVLALGLWLIPHARVPALVPLGCGALMLLWPGYLDALQTADRIIGGTNAVSSVPAVVTVGLVVTGITCTVAAVRWPRLIGPASVLVSGYWYPYTFAVGLASLVPQPPRARRADERGMGD